jgi:hypothetical protein
MRLQWHAREQRGLASLILDDTAIIEVFGEELLETVGQVRAMRDRASIVTMRKGGPTHAFEEQRKSDESEGD